MHEIKATTEPIYFVARDDDGNVLHAGVVKPGQTVTTGQKNLIFGDEAKQITELEKFVGKRPDSNHKINLETRKWELDTILESKGII